MYLFTLDSYNIFTCGQFQHAKPLSFTLDDGGSINCSTQPWTASYTGIARDIYNTYGVYNRCIVNMFTTCMFDSKCNRDDLAESIEYRIPVQKVDGSNRGQDRRMTYTNEFLSIHSPAIGIYRKGQGLVSSGSG